MEQLDNTNISKHLGQTSQYKSEYDPELIVTEPRQSNRTYLGIEDDNLPFVGYDVWNGYEVSALTNNGKPVAAIAKIIYPADSKYIVESKSMKLYWNSFNMTKLGDTPDEVMGEIEKRAIEDLSARIETNVSVQLFFDDTDIEEEIDFSATNNLDISVSNDVVFDTYNETPDLLEFEEYLDVQEVNYTSGLLKSNCRVTSQPDWGDVYIYMKGNKVPTPESLLKYIVSFRDECHFHEEICECIYKRLWDLCSPEELSVMCLYVRRGGWDINPHRVSHEHLYNELLYDIGKIFPKRPRQ
jgi:7-cyano-7-deazaguanine reductase